MKTFALLLTLLMPLCAVAQDATPLAVPDGYTTARVVIETTAADGSLVGEEYPALVPSALLDRIAELEARIAQLEAELAELAALQTPATPTVSVEAVVDLYEVETTEQTVTLTVPADEFVAGENTLAFTRLHSSGFRVEGVVIEFE